MDRFQLVVAIEQGPARPPLADGEAEHGERGADAVLVAHDVADRVA